MNWQCDSMEAAKVTLTTAAVQRRIAVEHFLPEPFARDPHAVVLSDNRSEVTHEEQLVLRSPPPPQEADHAPLNVLAIHPGEPAGIKIQFMKRRLAAIESVQIAHPARQ